VAVARHERGGGPSRRSPVSHLPRRAPIDEARGVNLGSSADGHHEGEHSMQAMTFTKMLAATALAVAGAAIVGIIAI
jgi:hypothetical protein